MRIAIFHYWYLLSGGGERVVEALATIYPQAELFCLFADPSQIPKSIRNRPLKCSLLNSIPLSRRVNRAIFPLYPYLMSEFDFNDYDLVITSDSPPTKNIRRGKDTVHVSYCHTPGRFIWDLAEPFERSLPLLARPVFGRLAKQARTADFNAAQKIDTVVANSKYIAARIHRYYGLKSTVVYPPVDVEKGFVASRTDDYYLSVGRLTATKRVDLAITACNQLKRRLLVIGAGREEKRLKALSGSTIEFLGRVSDDELPPFYSQCKALLFAADEDFGIVPVEVQSYGRPVIAFGHGGSLETVIPLEEGRQQTGVFFGEQTTESVIDGINRFERSEHAFNPHLIRSHAQQFDRSIFATRMESVITSALAGRESRSPVSVLGKRALGQSA